MQITVKEAKFFKEGESKKGKWKLYKVIADDGTEYTTFDGKASHLTPGTIIDTGPITLDGDNRSLKKVTIVSEPAGVKPNGDMSKEDWTEKNRIERESIEAQTAFKGIIELANNKVISLDNMYLGKALEWARAKIDANMGIPKQYVYQLGETGASGRDTAPSKSERAEPTENLRFANVGEFLAACNNAGVPRNKVMEKLGVDEKSLPRINIAESWDIIYEEIIKPSKELME